jgi:hypothetical protein
MHRYKPAPDGDARYLICRECSSRSTAVVIPVEETADHDDLHGNVAPVHRCGSVMRPSTREDEVFPGDASRYPYACDHCNVLVAGIESI